MAGLFIWYSEYGPGRAVARPSFLLAVPNVTAHPSTASVPTSYHSVWHYKGLKSGLKFVPKFVADKSQTCHRVLHIIKLITIIIIEQKLLKLMFFRLSGVRDEKKEILSKIQLVWKCFMSSGCKCM